MLHIPPVHNKFEFKDNTLYKLIQDSGKIFETLIVQESLVTTILINSHYLQGHTGMNKTDGVIKRDSFKKDMCKDIKNLFKNCHTCKIIISKYNYTVIST